MVKKTRFEYDEHKNLTNIRKHGLSFETASSAFNDPAAVIIYDEDHSTNEERYNLIGAVKGGILFIVYTVRDETIRMISARPATNINNKDNKQCQVDNTLHQSLIRKN